MYSFEKSISIGRSIDDVFEFVTNPANAPKWQSGVESAEWTSPDPGKVGSTWMVVNKFLGRRIEAELEVIEADPPNSLTSKIVKGPLPFEASLKFESKDNGTHLTIKSTGEFAGFFKLAEGLVGKQAEKQTESDFAALKLLMEAS